MTRIVMRSITSRNSVSIFMQQRLSL